MYEEAASTIDRLTLGPDDFIGLPETILVMLDGPEKAAGTLQKRIESTSSELHRKMLQFLADPDMPPEELLSFGAPESRNNRAMALKLIAFRHLSRSETAEAIGQLEACLDVTYWLPDSVWAHAFLSKLKDN